MLIEVYFDGACKNVKDLRNADMGIGVAVYIDKEYNHEHSAAVFISASEFGAGTSNVAEWCACVLSLSTIVDLKIAYPKAQCIVYSDSQLITNQYNGKYRVGDNFKEFHTQAEELGRITRIVLVNWIPRELNKRADMLSKLGLNKLNKYGESELAQIIKSKKK